MAAPPTLLMACLSVMAALAGGAGSGGHGSHADLAQARHYCRNMTWHEFRSEKCVRRRSLAAISESTIECDAAYESQEFQQYADYICHDVCPIFGSGELQCGASHHARAHRSRHVHDVGHCLPSFGANTSTRPPAAHGCLAMHIAYALSAYASHDPLGPNVRCPRLGRSSAPLVCTRPPQR